MKNLINLFIFFLFLFTIDLKGVPLSITNSPLDEALFSNVFPSVLGQGIDDPVRSSTFSFTCSCGALIVIQRGLNVKTGLPFIREWVRLPNTSLLRRVKLEPEAAQDPSRIATCEEICNGNIIYLN